MGHALNDAQSCATVPPVRCTPVAGIKAHELRHDL